MDAVIIDSGGANLASLQFAFERLGAKTRVSADAAESGPDARRTNSHRADLPIPVVRHTMRSSLKPSAIPDRPEALTRKLTALTASRLWQASSVG